MCNNNSLEKLLNMTQLFAVCTVRQLEQQIKSILDSIAVSKERKKELIRGDAVDKAEQLSEFSLVSQELQIIIIPFYYLMNGDQK